MSSPTVVIEVVGVEGPILEFWAATVPQGSDGSWGNGSNVGCDHPAFGLMVVRGSNNYANPLASRLESVDATDSWWKDHWADHAVSMDLVSARPQSANTTGTELTAAIHARSDWKQAVLDLAPSALYRLTMKDPGDIAHLRAREVFDSTAFDPIGHPARRALGRLATGGDGPFAALRAAMARVPENPNLHLYRRYSDADGDHRGKPFDYGVLDSNTTSLENLNNVRISNRVREIFLRWQWLQIAYLDATVPGFKPGKWKFKKGVPGGDSVLATSGARGFYMSPPWMFGAPRRGTDGVPRVPFDYLHPDGVAWIDLEGEPRVRVSPDPVFGAGSVPTGVDPALPSADVDEYLAAAAARIAADVERR